MKPDNNARGGPDRKNSRSGKPRSTHYDIFISYRRDKGSVLARFLVGELTKKGFNVFLDIDNLGAGAWDSQLEKRIDECTDFIAIVTDGYLDEVRINKPDDVVRQEIARAIEKNKNIVPLLINPEEFSKKIPENIKDLPKKNGVKYTHEYSNAAIQKLCSHLKASPLLGAERLYTSEIQPKVIVGLAGVFLGGLLGKKLINQDTIFGLFWDLLAVMGSGIIVGLLYVALIGIPALISLSIVGHYCKIRRDVLYGGPWIPFWCVFLFTVAWFSPLLVTSVSMVLGIRSDFMGGLLGGVAGAMVTALFAYTRFWHIISTMFKGQN